MEDKIRRKGKKLTFTLLISVRYPLYYKHSPLYHFLVIPLTRSLKIERIMNWNLSINYLPLQDYFCYIFYLLCRYANLVGVNVPKSAAKHPDQNLGFNQFPMRIFLGYIVTLNSPEPFSLSKRIEFNISWYRFANFQVSNQNYFR